MLAGSQKAVGAEYNASVVAPILRPLGAIGRLQEANGNVRSASENRRGWRL